MTSTMRAPTVAAGGLPVLGHALEMKRRPGEFLLSLQSGDPVVRLRLGRTPVFVVNDPALIRQLLLDPATFGRGGPITDRFRQLFGNGLGISDGDLHRRQRSLLTPAFNHAHTAGYATIMSDVAREMTQHWQDGQVVRVEKDMDVLALTVVTRVIFADEIELDRARFMAETAVVLGGLFRKVADTTGVLTRLPTPANRRYARAAEYLHATINDVIEQYRVHGVDHGDLLSTMMHAVDGDGRPAMTDQQLHDEVLTLFIGGSNTIANTLAWACHELATHPDVEKQLHAEVDEVLAGRPAEFADVARLDYTRRVISETLRVRTQGLFLAKVTTRDTEFGGYAIPAGATVIYSAHGLNHNPTIHSDPERFDPDRWLPERAKSIPKGAFMPFGMGAHSCIAEGFAWTEMVISLATVAANWQLESVPGHQPRPKPAITMPVDALPMTATRRGPQLSRLRSSSASGKG
ncbi:MAG TPA: cytochrome P450 [Jatrophihabitans sp.]|nr:cytochrome P450 [Jatrophihabitans sp.]